MERDCPWISCEDVHSSPVGDSSSSSSTGEEDKEQKPTDHQDENDDIVLKSERKDSDIKVYGDDNFEKQFNFKHTDTNGSGPSTGGATVVPGTTSTSKPADTHHRWIPLFWGEVSKT